MTGQAWAIAESIRLSLVASGLSVGNYSVPLDSIDSHCGSSSTEGQFEISLHNRRFSVTVTELEDPDTDD